MIHRILVPVDFSPASDAALEYAGFLGERLGAAIDVVHVWDPPPLLHGTEALFHAAHDRAASGLRSCMGDLAGVCHVPARGRLVAGSPALAIARVARREGHDLIVMGLHPGRARLARLLRGRVSREVVKHAPCPVLLVIPGEAARRAVTAPGVAEETHPLP